MIAFATYLGADLIDVRNEGLNFLAQRILDDLREQLIRGQPIAW